MKNIARVVVYGSILFIGTEFVHKRYIIEGPEFDMSGSAIVLTDKAHMQRNIRAESFDQDEENYLLENFGMNKTDYVKLITQDGKAVPLRGFLKTNIEDPFAKQYVLKNIIAPAEKEFNMQGGADKYFLFDELWNHFSTKHKNTTNNEVLRNKASILEKIVNSTMGFVSNNSVQTFKEYVSSDMHGGCDDISVALYVAYEIIAKETKQNEKKSHFWKINSEFFNNNQLVIARLQEHAAAILISEEVGKNHYQAIEPQSLGYYYSISFEEEGVFFVDETEKIPLLGLYHLNEVYGSNNFFKD